MAITISTEEFQRFRTLIYDESGISLNDQKQGLVASRLSKRLRELGVKTFSEYYDRLMHDADGEEFTRMLDLISTNKTDFFREPQHFDYLREEILPQLAQEKKVRIWSSASSTGEEPYTIAMTLYDGVADPANWDFKILASDLSTRVLAKAAGGVYDADRVDDMPPDVVRRHFLRGKGEHEGRLKVKPHLASMVRFRRINLMDDHFPVKSPLDLIFCRNVMIYFDRPTQETLVNKFHRYLKLGGHLFIGHSESLQWVTHPFRTVAPTIYRKEMWRVAREAWNGKRGNYQVKRDRSMKIVQFWDLKVWQLGKEFVPDMYRITKQFPWEERYGLMVQMRQAAVFIPSNVTEGYNRVHNTEYRQFLYVALGSCAELETQLEIARDRGYLDQVEYRPLVEQLDHETRMLRNLIKKL